MFAADLMSAGLGQAAVRPRHLSVVHPDKKPSFTVPAMLIAAVKLGPKILAAPDPVFLEIALDELLGEPELCNLLRVVTEEHGELGQSSETHLPVVSEVLSDEQTDELLKLGPIYELWFQLRSRWMSLVGTEKAVEAIPQGERGLLDRLYDATVPPQLSMIYLDGLRGEVAALGLLCAAYRKTPVAPWMARELIRYMAKGVYESVRLLASIPELKVSDADFPVADRLDLSAIIKCSHRAEIGSQVLLMLADVTGEPLTPWKQLPDSEP